MLTASWRAGVSAMLEATQWPPNTMESSKFKPDGRGATSHQQTDYRTGSSDGDLRRLPTVTPGREGGRWNKK